MLARRELRGTLLSKADIVSRSTLIASLVQGTTCPDGRERPGVRASLIHPGSSTPPLSMATEPVSKYVCKRDMRGAPGARPQTPLPTLCSAHKCPLSRVCPQWWEHLVSNSHLPMN